MPDRSGGDEREIEAALRERSFSIAHATGEKRRVVFLDVALEVLARVRGVRDDNEGRKGHDTGCVLPSAHKGPCKPRSPQDEDHEAIRCGACGSTDTYGYPGNAGCKACGAHDQDGG